MRLSGKTAGRRFVVLCGLLVFCLVLGTGTGFDQPWAGPDTAWAGDPEGGDGTPSDPPPPPEGGSATSVGDSKTVDPDEESDTLVEKLFAEVVDVLSGLWR